MNYIFLDLEFSPLPKALKDERRAGMLSEIIQIGAVKMICDNGEYIVVDKYESNVKPMYTMVSPMVTRLTGITNEDVENCASFQEALSDFINWIGDEPYKCFAWSPSDKNQILSESLIKKYDNALVKKHFIDLQRIYRRAAGYSKGAKCISLQLTLNSLDINYDEKALHGAEYDAYCTAMVYKTIKEHPEKIASIREMLSPKETPKNTVADFIDTEQLSKLYALCSA